MRSPLVVVVGSANMDLVVECARLPVPGETVLGSSFRSAPGGKGANQAVAIARLGGNVEFAGKVGRDAFGDELAMSLEENGVGVKHLLRDEGPSGVAAISVDSAGENTIVVAPGANSRLTAEEVSSATVGADVVLTQLEIPLAATEAAVGRGRFLLNPAPAQHLPSSLLAQVDYLTPNQSEAYALTGIRPEDDASCLQAARALLDRGVRNVVFTLGSLGAFLANANGGRHLPTLEVRAVDATAAGDAFNGALAWFLSEGRDPENAVLLANCVGALCATRPGAQEAMPTRRELQSVASELL